VFYLPWTRATVGLVVSLDASSEVVAASLVSALAGSSLSALEASYF